ncbi:MAG: MFS transporter [Actinobacteria bacterium]|nr:MFS transporter [Actinomycetota bacterium]
MSTSLGAPARSGRLSFPATPDFRYLWGATSISYVGDGMSAAVLPLLVASLSTDPKVVAAVVVIRWLPWVLFALPAGVLADSWNRVRTMWICDLVRAGLTAALGIAVLTGAASIPLLMLVAFAVTTAGVLFDSSSVAVLPTMVGRDPDLVRAANSRLMTAQTLTLDFVGPPVGGALFGWSRFVPLLGDAASYLTSAFLLRRIRGDYRVHSAQALKLGSMRTSLVEGLRWLIRQPLLRSLTLLSGGGNLANFAQSSILVLFAQTLLGLDAVGFSLLLTTGSAGAVLGGLVAPKVDKRLGSAVVIRSTLLISAGGSLAMGLSAEPWMPYLIVVVTGFAVTVRNVVQVSLRQSRTPDELLGRVSSVHRLVSYGAIPLGAGIGGLLASGAGLRAAMFFASGIFVALAVLATCTVTKARVAEARSNTSVQKGR